MKLEYDLTKYDIFLEKKIIKSSSEVFTCISPNEYRAKYDIHGPTKDNNSRIIIREKAIISKNSLKSVFKQKGQYYYLEQRGVLKEKEDTS